MTLAIYNILLVYALQRALVSWQLIPPSLNHRASLNHRRAGRHASARSLLERMSVSFWLGVPGKSVPSLALARYP